MTQVPAQRRTGAAPSRPHAALRALLLALVPACYAGDFFDRLVDPDATAAFRITQLTLVDPHTYSGDMVSCLDSTATYNQSFAASIGSFDINTTLVLRPLDPALDSGTVMDIVPAACVDGETIANCTDKDVPPASVITASFNNIEGGACLSPVAGSQNPLYGMAPNEILHEPRSPCFVSAMIPSFSLGLAPTLKLPLSNVQIAAAYELEGGSQRLVQGVLRGFLSSSVAMTAVGTLNGFPFTPWLVLAGGGGCQPPMNPIDDIDSVAAPRDGVWMYFNFTAERVDWPTESATDTTTSTTVDPTTAGATDTTTAGPTTATTVDPTMSTATATTTL